MESHIGLVILGPDYPETIKAAVSKGQARWERALIALCAVFAEVDAARGMFTKSWSQWQ